MASDGPSGQANAQLVQHNGKEYRAIREGRAYILNPPTQEAASKAPPRWQPKNDEEPQSVFYNPIQQFNRDLSVLAIRAYGEHVLALKKEKAEKRRQKLARNGGEATKGKKRKRDEAEEEGEGETNAEAHQAKRTDIENKPTTTDADATPVTVETTTDGKNQAAVSEAEPPSFTVLDALSATGLRALRYASEIPFVTRVVANDLSGPAIESMKTNIEYNGLGKLIKPNIGDARAYMYGLITLPTSNRNAASVGKFDVIDLDPYGSAAPFMDAAVQGVKDGGLLCVTCTDAGVWASNGYPEKAFALYGGVPVKGYHSHEGGLRLILHGLATSAAKYGLAIEPLLSLSIDFYARVFVRIHKSPAAVKFISGNTMIVYNCDSGCGAWSTQPISQTKTKLDKKGNPFYHYGFAQGPTANPRCEHCGFLTHLGGPMWAGPLHNPHFIQRILAMLPGADRDVYQTVDRIEGMLTTALEEDLELDASTKETASEVPAQVDLEAKPGAAVGGGLPDYRAAIIPRVDPAAREPYPFYFHLGALSKVLHTQTISVDAFRGALCHLGYRSARSHTKPNTIRTNAPWDVIWEIMREWARQKHPIRDGALRPGTAGAAIMRKSRENLARLSGGGEKITSEESAGSDRWLSVLKQEVLAAVDSGRGVNDLVTKIEAALYRSTTRTAAVQPAEREEANETPAVTPTTTTTQCHPGEEVSKGKSRPHPSTLEVVFDETLGREASATHTKKRLVRYQINPRANWGPLSRAVGGRT